MKLILSKIFQNEIIKELMNCTCEKKIDINVYPLDYGDSWDDIKKNYSLFIL